MRTILIIASIMVVLTGGACIRQSKDVTPEGRVDQYRQQQPDVNNSCNKDTLSGKQQVEDAAIVGDDFGVDGMPVE